MDEIVISQAITQSYFNEFLEYMNVDVAIVFKPPSLSISLITKSKQGH